VRRPRAMVERAVWRLGGFGGEGVGRLERVR